MLKLSDYIMAMKQMGVEVVAFEGVPTASIAGIPKGGLAIDTTNGALYINVGTSSSASWSLFSALGSDISRSELSAAAGKKHIASATAQIATTGNTDLIIIAPEDGTLESVDFTSVGALAQDGSNYVTFSITNLGQSGGGSTAMLDAGDTNTTKTTTGSAINANSRRQLGLSATPSNLNVVKGDVLRFRAAATGTLAGAVAGAQIQARFAGTT